jgi:hypothetical protein
MCIFEEFLEWEKHLCDLVLNEKTLRSAQDGNNYFVIFSLFPKYSFFLKRILDAASGIFF